MLQSSLDALEQIDNSNQRWAALFIGKLIVAGYCVAIYFGRFPAAFLLAGSLAMVALVVGYRNIGRRPTLSRWCILGCLLLPSLWVALTNGGFTDPRTVLAVFGCVSFAHALFAQSATQLINALGLTVLLALAVLEWSGVLARIVAIYPQAPVPVLYWMSVVLGLTVFAGLLLTSRRIAAQTHLLEQALAVAEANGAELDTRNRELVTALARAEESEQVQSRFLSNMSHEIRNPLNGIKGLLESIESSNDATDSIREEARYALISANHLHALVNDILEIKRIEEGQFALAPESFDYHAVMRATEAHHRALAEQKGIGFITLYELDSLPRFVIGDAKAAMQVMFNLLGNAIKFTASGAVTVSASFADGWVTYTVSDTGIGMDEHTVGKLFERFMQGDTGIQKRFGGTGLGLVLTKTIVESAGGQISVESRLGQGSTFRCTLPMTVDQEREHAWRSHPEPDNATLNMAPEIRLTGVRVLCVDDSTINLKVVARPLIKAGAAVTTADSAAEALDLIRVHDFDIVLTDISMPEMSGEQLQAQLAVWKIDLPVIAITGNVLQEDVSRYLASGFADVLGKPLEAAQLLATVQAHCTRPA